MIPVILSGGSGTRLWPISRSKLPKQFCDIFEGSLQSLTIQRLLPFGTPWTVTSAEFKDLTLRENKKFNISSLQVLFEPTAKNTAAAIAWLCFTLQERGLMNSVVGVFPADHLIENEGAFTLALNHAQSLAETGRIVTLGIRPKFAATGYGYIQVDSAPLSEWKSSQSFAVNRFHEKPNQATANEFLSSGSYYWNAGIFIFKVQSMVNALAKFEPELWAQISQIKDDHSNLNDVYSNLKSISIDYAIMEKLGPSELSCIPCDCNWSDVGSWDVISTLLPSAKNQVTEKDSSGNYVFTTENRKYAFIDVHDMLVVDTSDAILISKRGSTQKVKDIYDNVKKQWPTLVNEHSFEYRPWGKYEVLRDTPDFKSKVIDVLPYSQLSYQSHEKREEFWIVTQGKGEVILNDQVIPVAKGSSVHIPIKSKHRMKNTSDQPLQFVEVQLGTYFGEDDIKRYQDDYQRN